MVVNDWLCQFLADILDRPVERPAVVETTALGAAYLAGLAAGVYGSLDAVAEAWRLDRRFEPAMPAARAPAAARRLASRRGPRAQLSDFRLADGKPADWSCSQTNMIAGEAGQVGGQ